MRFAPRGAALPETAIVLGIALMMLFGTFELGLIGLTQLSGDGAAFVAAHAAALGNDPNAAIASPFPNIAPNTVSVANNAPDVSNIPVDFQVQNASNRHGGVQIVRPAHTQATVNSPNVGIGDVLPQTDLSSGVIEGNMMVSGFGLDLAGTPINSDPTYATQMSYFSDDGNAPPYMIGFRYLYHCSPAPQAGCQRNAGMYAAGFAEYLDGSNWNKPNNGTASNGVYQALAIHQRVYAVMAEQLEAMSPAAIAAGDGTNTPLDPNPSHSPGVCMQTINAWDISMPQGYALGTTSIGTYPLNPLGDNASCS